MPRRRALVVALAASLALTACGASAPTPAPTPSAEPLRTIAACAATVVVPPDSVATVADASAPPTVSLIVGDAVTFPIPAGARLGVLGAADADVDATVCRPAAATATTAELVAVGEGYLRIGVQVGVQPVAKVLVKVTPG